MKENDFLQSRSVSELVCRNVRHAWTIKHFQQVDYAELQEHHLLKWDQVIARRLVCSRCATERVEYYGRDTKTRPFSKVKARYVYPQGYLYRGEADAPTGADYFEELFNRHVF
jgi:hypothetical protein